MDPADATLSVTVDHDPDGTPVIALGGELDLSTAPIAERAFATLPEPQDGGHVVVDMAELTFMDSSGLTVLVMAVNEGYAVRLRRPTMIIRQLIAATGLRETLPIEL